jgi:uncharacterized protein (DUF433 family)
MSATFPTDNIPLRSDASGALRVGESQVLLELVIRAFQDGATPEAIVQRYPSAELADVYSVAYYLRHRDLVEAYLGEREQQAEEVERRITTTQRDLADIRARIAAKHG